MFRVSFHATNGLRPDWVRANDWITVVDLPSIAVEEFRLVYGVEGAARGGEAAI